MKRLQFTPSATRDIRRLRDVIAEHDLAAAARVPRRAPRSRKVASGACVSVDADRPSAAERLKRLRQV